MKTKMTTIIAMLLFVMPLSANGDKPFFTMKISTFGEKTLEVIVLVEETVNDIDLDLSAIFKEIKQDEENIERRNVDITDIYYEEPVVDDFGIDTRAIYEEIIKEEKIK